MRDRSSLLRTRWAAIGAAVTVSLGGGGLLIANAASGPVSATVTIEPVRVLDSRDGVDVGVAGPFVSGAGLDLDVTGSVRTTTGTQIVVPDAATGVILNVTAVNPGAAGFVSVRPATAAGAPTTSSLNVRAGDIVPNAVTVQLPIAGPDAGKIEITYDAFGVPGPSTDILVDVVGYLTSSGGAGPGPAGPVGPYGPRGLSAWDVIPGGVTVTGALVYDTHATGTLQTDIVMQDLPGVAPVALGSGSVNFGGATGALDADATCSGTIAVPTAPPGKVCIYIQSSSGVDLAKAHGLSIDAQPRRAFGVELASSATANMDVYAFMAWAYTSPGPAGDEPPADQAGDCESDKQGC